MDKTKMAVSHRHSFSVMMLGERLLNNEYLAISVRNVGSTIPFPFTCNATRKINAGKTIERLLSPRIKFCLCFGLMQALGEPTRK